MDSEVELTSLKERLTLLKGLIKGELEKIDKIKVDLKEDYRRRDKEKYESARRDIAANLRKYEAEMNTINKRLSELESVHKDIMI